ncbi:MAG: GNAT superfamily N-acetyltransferase [Halobacteriales archaeon]|jgi:GNAT superfamily N-acetyltransferase
MHVREARPADRVDVRRVLDAAMLDAEGLPARIEAGDVLVAVADDRVLGACVLVPPDDAPDWVARVGVEGGLERGIDAHVEAIAVRRRRRGEGIGGALIDRAGGRGALSAAFEADVRPFYENLGFDVLDGKTPDGRLRAVWTAGRT